MNPQKLQKQLGNLFCYDILLFLWLLLFLFWLSFFLFSFLQWFCFRLVCEDFPELKYAVENVILKDYDAKELVTFYPCFWFCFLFHCSIINLSMLFKAVIKLNKHIWFIQETCLLSEKVSICMINVAYLK